MEKVYQLVLVIAITIFMGCSANKNIGKENMTQGVIEKVMLDGCSYLITLEDGKKIEPHNLKKEFILSII